MEHWWSDINGKTEVLEEESVSVPFFYHKSCMDWPGIKPWPPYLELCNYLSDLWYKGNERYVSMGDIVVLNIHLRGRAPECVVTGRCTMLLFQCHALAEEIEQYIEDWWFHKQDEDLHKYLCIDTLKSCCPDNRYGANCKPCPGFPDNVCNKSGKCKVGTPPLPAIVNFTIDADSCHTT